VTGSPFADVWVDANFNETTRTTTVPEGPDAVPVGRSRAPGWFLAADLTRIKPPGTLNGPYGTGILLPILSWQFLPGYPHPVPPGHSVHDAPSLHVWVKTPGLSPIALGEKNSTGPPDRPVCYLSSAICHARRSSRLANRSRESKFVPAASNAC
jgi:hypothetical protein